MEKRDIIVIIVAIFIVLIMAMYIKPLVTGKEAKLIPDEVAGLFGQKNNTTLVSDNETRLNISGNFSGRFNNTLGSGNYTGINGTNISKNATNMTKVPAVPLPTQWSGSPVQVGYNYTGQQTGFIPRTGPVSEDQIYSFRQKANTALFTEFKGSQPISTNTFEIPKTAGYWQVQYTVDYVSGLQDVKATEGGDDAVFQFNKQRIREEEDGVTKQYLVSKGKEYTKDESEDSSEPLVESYSVSVPSISIDVIQHEGNRSKTVRTLTPDGGLDPYLWNKVVIKEKLKQNAEVNDLDIDEDALDERVERIVDPRPWVERFDEQGNYSLNIHPKNLKSYDVQIKVSNGVNRINQTQKNPAIQANPLNETVYKYIQSYNADITNPDYFSSILSYIKSGSGTEINQTKQEITNTKFMVPKITSYSLYSTDRSNGNVRGEIRYEIKGVEKWMPLDIYLLYENNRWKLPEPILPKY